MREDAMNLANAIAATGGGNDELARMATNMQQIKTVGKSYSNGYSKAVWNGGD